MRLELTTEQAALLDRILIAYLSDLRMEIVATDDVKFRKGLKEEEEEIKRLLADLERPSQTGPG